MTISELPVVRIIDDNDVMRESLVFLLEEEDGWIVKALSLIHISEPTRH